METFWMTSVKKQYQKFRISDFTIIYDEIQNFEMDKFRIGRATNEDDWDGNAAELLILS